MRLVWARAGLGFSLLGMAAALVLIAVRPGDLIGADWGFRGFPVLITAAFTGVGYVIATRQPRNAIGWWMLGAALAGTVEAVGGEVATSSPPLPGAMIAGWLDSWIWTVSLSIIFGPVLALFPDGHPLTPRWGLVVRVAAVTGVLSAVGHAFFSPTLSNSSRPNPFALPGADDAIVYPLLILQGLVAIASAASLVLRYRRAGSVERHQLKWLAAAAGLLAVVFMVGVLTGAISARAIDAARLLQNPKPAQIAVIIALTLVPLAIGVAILRYRLYEIDVLINRALVYGMLTALLGGGFVAAQSVVQRMLAQTAGVSSDAVTIALVFTVAAVFTPLRARLQSTVDRRFKPESPAPKRAPADAVADTLTGLAALRDRGLITAADYDRKKEELLARL